MKNSPLPKRSHEQFTQRKSLRAKKPPPDYAGYVTQLIPSKRYISYFDCDKLEWRYCKIDRKVPEQVGMWVWCDSNTKLTTHMLNWLATPDNDSPDDRWYDANVIHTIAGLGQGREHSHLINRSKRSQSGNKHRKRLKKTLTKLAEDHPELFIRTCTLKLPPRESPEEALLLAKALTESARMWFKTQPLSFATWRVEVSAHRPGPGCDSPWAYTAHLHGLILLPAERDPETISEAIRMSWEEFSASCCETANVDYQPRSRSVHLGRLYLVRSGKRKYLNRLDDALVFSFLSRWTEYWSKSPSATFIRPIWNGKPHSKPVRLQANQLEAMLYASEWELRSPGKELEPLIHKWAGTWSPLTDGRSAKA